jgi:hypothetical protein
VILFAIFFWTKSRKKHLFIWISSFVLEEMDGDGVEEEVEGEGEVEHPSGQENGAEWLSMGDFDSTQGSFVVRSPFGCERNAEKVFFIALEKWCLDSAQAQSVDLMSPIHDAAARGNLERLKELVSVKKGTTDPSLTDTEWEFSKELINHKDEAKNTVRSTSAS